MSLIRCPECDIELREPCHPCKTCKLLKEGSFAKIRAFQKVMGEWFMLGPSERIGGGLQLNNKDVDSLLDKLEEAQTDYGKVVDKFDDVRACLAFVLEKLGGNPNDVPEHQSWHEYLIEQVNKKLKE